MEHQDNLFNQIKAAANNAETPNFASMDKVWNRVEEKLDKKELKSANQLWKKWAIAASLLLGISIGYQFLKNDKVENITKIDTIQKTIPDNTVVVVTNKANPAIKKEADAILQKQIVAKTQVALEEKISDKDNTEVSSEDIISSQAGYYMHPITANANTMSGSYSTESKSAPSKDVELFVKKENQVSDAHKEKPLIVIDDKIAKKQNLKNINADNLESIVELKEPLYIINGVEYSEQEVFGPNPTSPYTPLDQQEIETISILQDGKAVEAYGEKGKNGVVIITTKNGKPLVKESK